MGEHKTKHLINFILLSFIISLTNCEYPSVGEQVDSSELCVSLQDRENFNMVCTGWNFSGSTTMSRPKKVMNTVTLTKLKDEQNTTWAANGLELDDKTGVEKIFLPNSHNLCVSSTTDTLLVFEECYRLVATIELKESRTTVWTTTSTQKEIRYFMNEYLNRVEIREDGITESLKACTSNSNLINGDLKFWINKQPRNCLKEEESSDHAVTLTVLMAASVFLSATTLIFLTCAFQKLNLRQGPLASNSIQA
eukprot:GFYU01001514.1.p1 GENE.GFYU01001514.1~~GFYU01001514.1.p1  ORF type:complete len:251 (+),score=6.43 GFYU01001514.1:24-776(+)